MALTTNIARVARLIALSSLFFLLPLLTLTAAYQLLPSSLPSSIPHLHLLLTRRTSPPLAMAGFHEGWTRQDMSDGVKTLRMIAAMPQSLFESQSWALYRSRRGNIDAALATCRKSPSCPVRYRAWIDLIDRVKKVRDPVAKAEIVNGWVNSLIRYVDYSGNSTGWAQRYQTPFETLRSDSGLCVDYATLKYETLRRVGFSEDNLRLVAGDLESPQQVLRGPGHMVLMVRIDGWNWVLSNYRLIAPRKLLALASGQRAAFYSNAEMMPDVAYLRHDGLEFFPRTGMNEEGASQYIPDYDPAGHAPTRFVEASADKDGDRLDERLFNGDRFTEAWVDDLALHVYDLRGGDSLPAPRRGHRV